MLATKMIPAGAEGFRVIFRPSANGEGEKINFNFDRQRGKWTDGQRRKHGRDEDASRLQSRCPERSGGSPRPPKSFAKLTIQNIDWSPDGGRVVSTSGAQVRVVTPTRDFR